MKNVDGARFCNGCGNSLTGPPRDYRRDKPEECDECSSHTREGSIFWGIIVLLIGLWIIFEFGLKRIEGMPGWVYGAEFCWLIPVVIGIAILIGAFRIIAGKK